MVRGVEKGSTCAQSICHYTKIYLFLFCLFIIVLFFIIHHFISLLLSYITLVFSVDDVKKNYFNKLLILMGFMFLVNINNRGGNH